MRETDVTSLSVSPFTKIGREWMLIAAGDSGGHNTMTASWGGMGILWGKNAVTVYIRQHRHTFGFVEGSGYFSCCFFDEKYRGALNICGTKSGRDCDKVKEAGLTPVFDYPAPYYQEASLAFICRKLYHQDLREDCFTDGAIVEANYPKRDFHRMFVGEIVTCLTTP